MIDRIIGRVYHTYSDFELEFKWEINDFCYMDCVDVGDPLISPKFSTKYIGENSDWYLHLYPKGKSDECEEYLSLYLHSKEKKINAAVTFIIFNNKGQAVVKRTLVEDICGKASWGYEKFISRSFVQNAKNGCLYKGKLTIVCKIKYKNNEVESPIWSYNETKTKEVEDDILLPHLEDYEALLNDSKFSDLSLVSEGKALKVHKCILAKKSVVFATMLDTEMIEKQNNTVEITDIRFDVLVEMLRFIYAGKAKNIDMLASELAIAADKYAVDSLKVICEKAMKKNLRPDNVIESLQMADALHMDMLKKKAIEFIVEEGSDVTERPEFNLLSLDLVRKICQCSMKKVKQ